MSNDKVYGYVYIIRNKVNHKCYVGQTSQKGGFDRRYKHNILSYTHNQYLKRSILKYGIDNFEINKAVDLAYNKEELDRKEIYYIDLYKANDAKYGYNIKGGGSFGKLAESTKQKLSKINKGKLYSEEVNKKKGRAGERNSMFGKRHSEESKTKIREGRLGRYAGSNNPKAKPIECITTGSVFNCMREAGEYYGIKTYNHISRVCNGELKSCGKLSDGTKLEWRFVEEQVCSSEMKINIQIGAEKKAKQVKCLTTSKIFKSQREAGKYYNIKTFHHISECCCGKKYSCGKLVDGTPLRWAYV